MNAEDFQAIAVGDIIDYTLSPHRCSLNPPRAYKGMVNKIDPDAQMVSVMLLDEECEALNEPVRMDHIQAIVKSWSSSRKRQAGANQGRSH